MKQTRSTPPQPPSWKPTDPFTYPRQTDYPTAWWIAMAAIAVATVAIIGSTL